MSDVEYGIFLGILATIAVMGMMAMYMWFGRKNRP